MKMKKTLLYAVAPALLLLATHQSSIHALLGQWEEQQTEAKKLQTELDNTKGLLAGQQKALANYRSLKRTASNPEKQKEKLDETIEETKQAISENKDKIKQLRKNIRELD